MTESFLDRRVTITVFELIYILILMFLICRITEHLGGVSKLIDNLFN